MDAGDCLLRQALTTFPMECSITRTMDSFRLYHPSHLDCVGFFPPADGLGSSRQDGDDSITLRIQHLRAHDPSEARSDGHEGVVVFALWLCFSIHNTWTTVSVLVNGSEMVYSVILFQLGAMVMTRQESGVVPSRGLLLCRNNPDYHSFLRSGNAFASVHRHGSLWLRCSTALFCLLPYGVF